MKPEVRVRTVGSRVSEEEYAALEELAQAQGQSLSEWSRKALLSFLHPTTASPTEETVIAEVLALRKILLNLIYVLARGEPVNGDKMQQIIERADAEKFLQAEEQIKERAGKRAGKNGKPLGTR